MANAYTDTSTGSLGTNLVQAAYDRYVEFALRAIPLIRDVADKRPAQQAMPGSSVVFQLYSDMAKATTALTETTDPDAVALGNTTSVSVTLNEYGNAALATRKLELFSLSDVDPAIANIIAFNMADSLDELALTELRGGSNVIYSANSTGTVPTGTTGVGSTNTLKSADVRKAVAKLRAGKAVPRMGELYWVGIHPEVSHDLRAETGAGGWREAHVYNESGAGQLWPGSIGTYEGAMFVESPRLYNATDGASSTRVFRTIACGQQALAEAVAEEPHVIIGPVVDKLMRFRPIGWYGVLGWKRYREAALYRIESTSSINAS
jgi:N4-gp56 family major capsid protein